MSEPDPLLESLRSLQPEEFEKFVAQIWECEGWETEFTTATADEGIDIVARKQFPIPQKHLIQAKRYDIGNRVSSSEIQQYASLRDQRQGVSQVIVVTTSSYTEQAERLAGDLDVTLIDKSELLKLIGVFDLEDAIPDVPGDTDVRGAVHPIIRASSLDFSEAGEEAPTDDADYLIDGGISSEQLADIIEFHLNRVDFEVALGFHENISIYYGDVPDNAEPEEGIMYSAGLLQIISRENERIQDAKEYIDSLEYSIVSEEKTEEGIVLTLTGDKMEGDALSLREEINRIEGILSHVFTGLEEIECITIGIKEE